MIAQSDSSFLSQSQNNKQINKQDQQINKNKTINKQNNQHKNNPQQKINQKYDLININLQNISVSVKNQISQARNILPSSILQSQPIKHIISNIQPDFQSQFISKCYLDTSNNIDDINHYKINQQYIQAKNKQLYKKYGNNIINILNKKNEIVFLGQMAVQSFIRLYNRNKFIANINKKYKQDEQSYQQDEQDYQQNYKFGAVELDYHQYQKMNKNQRQRQKQKQKLKTQNITEKQVQCLINENLKSSQLQFSQKFESSNIHLAIKQCAKNYLIATRLDYNTNSYGQWFYFKVKNISNKNDKFRFTIINMTKTYSMFGQGLKISVCRNKIWSKEGQDIKYYQNLFKRSNKNNINNNNNNDILGVTSSLALKADFYYSLTFKINIKAGQQIYLASNQPYTYTRLNRKIDLLLLQNFYNKQISIKRSVISRTFLDNRIDMLTIALSKSKRQVNKPIQTFNHFQFQSVSSSPRKNQDIQENYYKCIPLLNKERYKQKKVIVITARTHPVQTAGSYVIQGIMQQLCKVPLSDKIKNLLQHYVIKIIPMMNPDGVIIGNSRCNLKGYDLNRMWNQPDSQKTPQIYNILKTIMKSQGKIQMFIDLHGHSKKKNVFAYGCHDFKQPFATREFPYLLSKVNKEDFLFKQCRFTRTQNIKSKSLKQGTARMTLWRKLKIHNIFTIQNSYCSAEGSQYHYDQSSYKAIGSSILDAICIYFNQQKQLTKCESTVFEKLQKSTILQQLRLNSENIQMGLQNAQQSQSEKQQRIQKKICKIFTKSKKKSQSKIKNQINGKILKRTTQSKPQLQRQTKYQQKSISPDLKYQKHPPVTSDKKKFESLVALRRFNIEQSLPYHIQSKRNTIVKPLSRNPYEMARAGYCEQLRGNSLGGIRSSKNISMRERIMKHGETLDYDRTKNTVLSIVQLGPNNLFPYYNQNNKSQNKRKNVIWNKDKKSANNIKVQQYTSYQKREYHKREKSQLVNNHINAYQISNALKRPNYTKLHDLVSKINKNKDLFSKKSK